MLPLSISCAVSRLSLRRFSWLTSTYPGLSLSESDPPEDENIEYFRCYAVPVCINDFFVTLLLCSLLPDLPFDVDLKD